MLQEGPVYLAESDLRQDFQETSSEGEVAAQDPSPDLEARLDFWSILEDYIFRNHVGPMTKLYVPKDDFWSSCCCV